MLCFDIQATALHVDLNKWMKIWKECSDMKYSILGIARDGISFGIWNYYPRLRTERNFLSINIITDKSHADLSTLS